MSELKQGQGPLLNKLRQTYKYDSSGEALIILNLCDDIELLRQRLQQSESDLAKRVEAMDGLAEELAKAHFTLSEQSKVVTKLCLAIDPDCQHGPESDKIADYAKHLRKTALEAKMGVILKCAHCNGLGQVMRYRVQDHIEYEKCDKCDGSGINDDATAKIFNLQSENEDLNTKLQQAEDAAATFANDVSRLAEQLDHFRNLHAASQQRIEQLEKSNGELCKAKGGLWKENENLKFWEIPTLRRLVESSQQRMAELEKDKERLDAAEKYAGNIDIYLKPMPRILTSQPWICCGESLRSALDKLKRDFDSATTQQEGEKL